VTALIKHLAKKSLAPFSDKFLFFKPVISARDKVLSTRPFKVFKDRKAVSLPPCPKVLGRLGALEVRLATTAAEKDQIEALRYQVFYEEMSARANTLTLLTQRDKDSFDAYCDHLLVVDTSEKTEQVVGTYRLLRGEVAMQLEGFYSAGEYDLAPFLAYHADRRFLELGRSCVLKPWRGKRTVELLWHGIWAYILHHQIDVMFGCASFETVNPDAIALPLSYLHYHARANDSWLIHALPERFVSMARLPEDQVSLKAAMTGLPPLIKGYLRVGAMVGSGAVIDEQFGTTDVMMILPLEKISGRYMNYYGSEAQRYKIN
jgi:putative hemolysin